MGKCQYYLTSSPPQLTVGKLMGNPIVSWTSNNCYIQCLSTTGNNWLTFCANNTVSDGTVLTVQKQFSTVRFQLDMLHTTRS